MKSNRFGRELFRIAQRGSWNTDLLPRKRIPKREGGIAEIKTNRSDASNRATPEWHEASKRCSGDASLVDWKILGKYNVSRACDRDHRLQAEWEGSMQRMK
jgi:hypothetical protein